jgi:hypothetical protein
MKTLITFLVCGLAIAGPAQTSLKTFTSADGVFRFQYSDVLVNACTSEQTPGNPASCKSQSTICDGPGSEGITLACFSYPNERFKNKTSYVGTDFYVSEIQSATTEQVCLRASPNWYVISSKPGITTINHVSFKTFEIGDNWTSHGQSGPAYRTFHDGKCYELGIQTLISRAEYDPGTVKEFTKKDSSEVEGCLRGVLNSFVFLK